MNRISVLPKLIWIVRSFSPFLFLSFSFLSRGLTQSWMSGHRTFPTNVFFAGTGPGVAKLRNVLVAYSWSVISSRTFVRIRADCLAFPGGIQKLDVRNSSVKRFRRPPD